MDLHRTWLVLACIACLWPLPAQAQVVGSLGAAYEPDTSPAAPRAAGLRALAVFERPDYAETLLGLRAGRSPYQVLGADDRGNMLAPCAAGMLSLSPTGGNALRLTTSAMDAGGISSDLGALRVTVDELGWLYVSDPFLGLVRLAVTRPTLVLYSPEALAKATFSALPPQVLEIESFGDRLLLAAGNAGLIEALRSGRAATRTYDAYIDAEAAGLSGAEAELRALSRTPRGEPLLAVVAGGQSYVGVQVGERSFAPVGTQPLLSSPVAPGGLAALGDGGYLAATDAGVWWFDLAGSTSKLLEPDALRSALQGVGSGTASPRTLLALDGCEGTAVLVTDLGVLAVAARNLAPQPEDLLVALPDQQTLLRLARGLDPLPIWTGRPLVGPRQAVVDAAGQVWVVDPGGQTVLRFTADLRNLEVVRPPRGAPRALRFDSRGRALLLDLALEGEDGSRPGITTVDLTGEGESVIVRGDPLQSPVDFVVDGNGNFVLADSAAHKLWILIPGEAPIEMAQVEAPVALALGGAGEVYALSLPQRAQASLLRVQSDGSLDVLWTGEPLVQPTGLAVRADGSIVVADARADAFPAQDPGLASTASLFVFDPATRAMRPYLDVPAIRRNGQGIGLSAVPGRAGPHCGREPFVRPPSVDPFRAPEPEAEESSDEGCALVRPRALPSVGRSLLPRR